MIDTSRKKIVYVITKSLWGGAQRYVYDLATSLPRDTFKIAVAAGGNGPLLQQLQDTGIHTISIPGLNRDVHFFSELRALWELFLICVRERPDILHLNSSKVGGLGALAARAAQLWIRKPIHVVFTVHGWGFHEVRPQWQNNTIRLVSWVSSLLQDSIITINSADHAAAQKFIPPHKLTRISNGIHEINFLSKEDARSFLARHVHTTLSPQTIVLGTIAELTKNKGLPYLIDAIHYMHSRYPSLVFQTIIIGGGEDRKNLEQAIKTRNLSDTVHLAGFLPHASRYLRAFDAFVLPSLKEGLPYSIMEAMTAEIPIIASNTGGIPDLITHGVEGFLHEPTQHETLAAHTHALLSDAKELNRMGHAAQQKVANHFSLPAMVNQTAQLYRSFFHEL